MMIFNKIYIHLTDSTVTIYNPVNKLIVGPFCGLKQNQVEEVGSHYCRFILQYPYYGSVVADFEICKRIVKFYLRKALPKIHFRTFIHVTISPITGEIEQRAVGDLFDSRHVIYHFEPIVFLVGISQQNGIVISLNKTILEITLVEEYHIKHYKWSNIANKVLKNDWYSIYKIINRHLDEVGYNNSDCNSKLYLIGENNIVKNIYSIFKSKNNERNVAVVFDANEIIVKNMQHSPIVQ